MQQHAASGREQQQHAARGREQQERAAPDGEQQQLAAGRRAGGHASSGAAVARDE